MGWGICFGLDDNFRLYCVDGCKWKASEKDYEQYYPWPSARAYILDYYEHNAHSELDMIRDECPGTASALAQACPDYMGLAFCSYRNLSADEKMKYHNDMLSELNGRYETTNKELKDVTETWKNMPPAPKFKKPKSSIEKMEQDIQDLKWKLEMEKVTTNMKYLRRVMSRIKKFTKLENSFEIEL